MMDSFAPLQSLYEKQSGEAMPLPPEIVRLYGALNLPAYAGRPYLVGNFVTTLDGVVSLLAPGKKGGGEISGNSRQDHFVMGVLRATADAIIIGAGTLRDSPGHRWTAAHIFPEMAPAYQQMRAALGKPEPPLNVIVSARGDVSMSLALMQDGSIPVLIVTTDQGAQRIHAQQVPQWVQVAVVKEGQAETISARAVLQATQHARQCSVILTEGGPQLLGTFLAERLIDELFLTLAPQIAGRDGQGGHDGQGERPGLVTGQLFAPDDPRWGELVSVKRGESHLFLRYAF